MTPQQLVKDAHEATQRIRQRHDALLQVTPSTATFDNTFGALGRVSYEADLVDGYLNFMYYAGTGIDAQEHVYRSHCNSMRMSRAEVYNSATVQKILQQWAATGQVAELTPERQHFVSRCTRLLKPPYDEPTRRQLTELNRELNNRIDEYIYHFQSVENTWHYVFRDRKQLEGVPPSTLTAMEENARQRGFGTAEQPAWLFTLNMRAMVDINKYCRVEATRKKCWQGVCSIGNTKKHDNGPIVMRIMELRQNIAELKGFSNHTDSVADDALMNSGKKALAFVDGLLDKIQPQLITHQAAVMQEASRQCGREVTQINPWDYEYYSHIVNKSVNKFSISELRPYLEYENTLKETFKYFGNLYGLTIQELPTTCVQGDTPCPAGHVEVWHPDIRVFSVQDAASGKNYGAFYLDAYKRSGRKFSTSCSYPIRIGTTTATGQPGMPSLAALVLDLNKPAPGNTQLLSHLELRILFHELGHIFHMLLGNAEFAEQSSLYIARDFIELPSTLQEQHAWEADVLCKIGRHYRTGEPLPREMALKATASRHDADYLNLLTQQLMIAKLDLEMHTNYREKFHGKNLDVVSKQLYSPYFPPSDTVSPSIIRRFPHCVEGYDARYYSYILAEVMAADMHEEFKRHGFNNSAIGRNFRKTILEPGNTRPAVELYRNFMGRGVSSAAFLQHLLK